jgi:hypothetical protein
MELVENNFDENETKFDEQHFTDAKIRFVKNAWDKMDERKRAKLKKTVTKKLKTDQEIQDLEKFFEYLDSNEQNSAHKRINLKNEQGQFVETWIVIDIVVWTLLALTCCLCTIS